MSFPKINPTTTQAWQKLDAHFEAIHDAHIQELFASEKGRRKAMTIVWEDLMLDYSKMLNSSGLRPKRNIITAVHSPSRRKRDKRNERKMPSLEAERCPRLRLMLCVQV